MITIEEFNRWLQRPEGLNLEFKEARNEFSKDKNLPDYCAALANESGGKLILGVTDKGRVVGTKAFLGQQQKLSSRLLNNLKIRVDVEELLHPDGRVVIFHITSRPLGQTIKSTGSYHCPMRAGESLAEMDDLTLKRILNESSPDFSNQIVECLSLNDLDANALQKLRDLRFEKTKNNNYLTSTNKQFLSDLGLLSEKGLNYAGLILMGKKEALDNYLPQAEIILEWRQIPEKTPFDFRKSWREPFMNIFDDIWEEIDKRNLRTPYQEGFIQKEILAFDRQSIREAILNAVAHRDYPLKGQVVFISASPAEFLIESPGGFLPGITPENALYNRAWRNQRLAETFEKTGLKVGRTRGAKYLLSHKYYTHEGKIGVHTRLIGLSREQKKELILNHLRKNQRGFIEDFKDAFPDLKQKDVSNLLQELKRTGKVIYIGKTKNGYWALKNGSEK